MHILLQICRNFLLFARAYDRINFAKLRLRFIKNINNFFKRYNIPSENYINLFANNRYFPQYIKNNLMKEFLQFGQVKNDKIMSLQLINMPIIFTIPFLSIRMFPDRISLWIIL